MWSVNWPYQQSSSSELGTYFPNLFPGNFNGKEVNYRSELARVVDTSSARKLHLGWIPIITDLKCQISCHSNVRFGDAFIFHIGRPYWRTISWFPRRGECEVIWETTMSRLRWGVSVSNVGRVCTGHYEFNFNGLDFHFWTVVGKLNLKCGSLSQVVLKLNPITWLPRGKDIWEQSIFGIFCR